LAFKFELKTRVRVWWEEKNNSTKIKPMEKHVIQQVNETNVSFIPYYEDSMCTLETINNKINLPV
jgi:hypothetical protein